MRSYIHTHFASQAPAIEIYFRIQSKVQKEEQKVKERSGRPEISMPEYMLYMNAVGSFLKPGLVVQKTETPKTDSPEKGWQKVVYKKKNRLRQFKPKVTPSFSEFVKSYNPFDKLKGEDKTTVGMSSELGREKVSKPNKPISKPVKPRRVREGFCELCRLPGHVKKYCWTYREEDISDKPCDICEGRHGASPCYFDPEMYNKYHEGQPPRELYLRRAEETRQVVIDEIGPHGEIYHKKVYPPGGYYPWKGREYMGPNLSLIHI